MTTSPATKHLRLAALGVSAVMTVGVLAPFVGISSASADDCTTASSAYSTASTKLAKDQAKLTKAKKKLKKAKKHHRSHTVIKHDKKKVKKFRGKVRSDRSVRNYYAAKVTTCSGGASNTPQTGAAAANPLSQLLSLLTGGAAGLSPAALTDTLGSLGSQIAASGAPGADQLGSTIKEIADQIAANSSSLDPTAFQNALTSALQQVQAELQAAAADPTGLTVQGLIDDVIDPLVTGLTQAGIPGLPDLLTQLQDVLDPILSQIPGLGVLLGGGTLTISGLG